MGTVTETVFSLYGNELPRNALEFLRWFAEQLATIPEHYRADAELVVEWDENGTTISLTYRRLQTAEEFAESERYQRERTDQRIAHEKAVLAALKAKYEGQP